VELGAAGGAVGGREGCDDQDPAASPLTLNGPVQGGQRRTPPDGEHLRPSPLVVRAGQHLAGAPHLGGVADDDHIPGVCRTPPRLRAGPAPGTT
jgi:hypothetical protein